MNSTIIAALIGAAATLISAAATIFALHSKPSRGARGSGSREPNFRSSISTSTQANGEASKLRGPRTDLIILYFLTLLLNNISVAILQYTMFTRGRRDEDINDSNIALGLVFLSLSIISAIFLNWRMRRWPRSFGYLALGIFLTNAAVLFAVFFVAAGWFDMRPFFLSFIYAFVFSCAAVLLTESLRFVARSVRAI